MCKVCGCYGGCAESETGVAVVDYATEEMLLFGVLEHT